MKNNKSILDNPHMRTNHKQSQKKLIMQNRKSRPALRFSPAAWAKLLYFRDKTDNEVGGFGITEPDDLLYVKEFVTVKQEVTAISVRFNDEAVADFFDDQIDLGRRPEQFARLWLHSHPGRSPKPSTIDEDTFKRVFGNCQWAVLFIVALDNRTYAELSFSVGPGGHFLIPVEVDYSRVFGPSEHELWDAEYAANVKAVKWFDDRMAGNNGDIDRDISRIALPYGFLEEFEKMDPQERRFILDEMAQRPDLWEEEDEVMRL